MNHASHRPRVNFAACLILTMAGVACPNADALVIDITGSGAFASAGYFPYYDSSSDAGTVSASASYADATSGAVAVASVPDGHLGASAFVYSSSPRLGARGLADAGVTMSFTDVTPGDFIQVQTFLNGSFAPVMGDGGTVSLFVSKNFDSSDFAGVEGSGISCSYYNQQYNGSACRSQIYGQPVTNGSAIVFDIPLVNIDTLALQWELQVGASNGGSASFLNSADFSVVVPEGTYINGNPGGALFSGASEASGNSVPEPGTLALLGLGLVPALLLTAGARKSPAAKPDVGHPDLPPSAMPEFWKESGLTVT